MYRMYNAREEIMNILCHVDFAKLCNAIQLFPGLNQNIVGKGITFTLLSSSRYIKWKKKINELEPCMEQINTRTYHDFSIYTSSFKEDSIFTTGNKMRRTCSDLFENQYKQLRIINSLISQVT